MIDQANDLRKLVMQAAENRPDGLPERVPMLLVSGGKGGVGTTTVAVNVAVAAAQRGLRAVLIDADPDRADVQSLCRLRDRYTVSDVLSGRRTLGEALQPGPAGVFVLPGAWAVADLADASESSQVRLLDQFAALGPRADVVVIDGGNGLHPFTRRLWRSCAEVVLVATPEPSAVLDAYAAIKVAASPPSRPTVRLLVNMCPSAAVADDVHGRIAQSCRRFLGFELPPRHWLPIEPCVSAAGREATPFVISHPAAPAARALIAFARVVEDALGGIPGGAAANSAPEGAIGGEPKRENQLIQTGTNADNEEDHRLVARCQSLTTA